MWQSQSCKSRDEPSRARAGFAEALALLEEPSETGHRRWRDAMLQTSVIEAARANAGLGHALNAVKQAYVAAETAPSRGCHAGGSPDLEALRAMIRRVEFPAKDLRLLRRAFARAFHPDIAGQQHEDMATAMMTAVNCMIDDALVRACR
jgi:hypothetical protein